MVLDLFSKRRKRERGEVPDVYTYDALPPGFRAQVVHIFRDAIELASGPDEQSLELYHEMHDLLAREYGVFELHNDAKSYRADFRSALFNFFLQANDVEHALDVVELGCRCIERVVPEWQYYGPRKLSPERAMAELNLRFQEHGIGYQYESGQVIRVDSAYTHAEAVKPALHLLRSSEFHGANEEFLRAHEHYRHERYKEALNDALKALESTLKIVCERRGWSFKSSDTAKDLLGIVFAHELIPGPLQAHFAALRSTLETGLPTVRNKLSGHGQGSTPLAVPAYIASYAVNLAAVAIRLLVEAHEG